MEKVLHIENLILSYANKQEAVLTGINLEVNKGEIVVLLGENGSGKSTLLKSIAGQLKPKSGSIKFYNKAIELWTKKGLAENLGWVDTQLSFSEYISVEEFIAFGRYPFTNWLGKLRANDLKIISTVIKNCKLDHLRSQSMARLSDGEKQKVFIARALAQETSLLLLDEPTTHLDTKNTAGIFSLLKQQGKMNGKTLIFSSHKFEHALLIADKIWLFDGKGIISTTPEEFKRSNELQGILLDDLVVYDKEKGGFNYNL